MIRAYRSSDCTAVLDVWAAASAVAHAFLPKEHLAAERRDIAELHLPAAQSWVWVAGEHVVGFIAMVGNEIGGLFVDPAHHGRGIGRALVDHVRKSHDELEVEVFKENALGRAFYAAYGFVEDHEGVHSATGFKVLRLSLPRPVPPQLGKL
jgi:putative acetyltransferase